ncbi:MAG: tetratricopeptide repeat protein [Patescibacteria group bacterium]
MVTQRTSIVNGWIPLILILFVTTLVYLPIFRNNFTIDDHVFIGKYHPSIAEAFRGAVPSGHEGVYRPVRAMIYTAYYNLFGTNPFWYHLHSLLIHLAATVLVFFIVSVIARSDSDEAIPLGKRLLRQVQSCTWLRFARNDKIRNGLAMTAGVAALLFGLHPVHTESITYIAASMEMTGVVFMLGAFWLFVRSPRRRNGLAMTLSVVLALLAFFTYEMTITLPILLVLYEWILRVPSVIPAQAGIQRRKDWIPVFTGMTQRVLPYFFGAGVYLFIRFFVLGITSRGTYLGGSIWYTILTLPKVLMHYLWVTVWPVGLVNNHIISPGIEAFVYRGYRTVAILGQSILDPEILGAIGVIGGIGVIGWKMRKKYPLVSFGIAWFFISLLPVMGFVPGGSMFNERMLYIPSVGFVMVAGWALGRLGRIRVIRMIGVIGVIALLYGMRTAVRNRDWHDDVTLWQKDVAAAPTENAYAYFALGNAYNDRKDYAKALEAYLGSVTINPGFAVGYASLSRTYRDMGNMELSNVYYQKAAEAETGFWRAP